MLPPPRAKAQMSGPGTAKQLTEIYGDMLSQHKEEPCPQLRTRAPLPVHLAMLPVAAFCPSTGTRALILF
jgi:hypothetical protein